MGDAWTIAVVVSWWAFCGAVRGVADDPTQAGAGLGLVIIALLLVALARWVVYGAEHHPPISLFGRLWTGRLIVPGYDVVAVAPLTAAALAVAVPLGLWRIGTGVPVAAAAGTLAVMAVVLLGGPTLRHWQLTGHHRVVPRHGRERTPRRA